MNSGYRGNDDGWPSTCRPHLREHAHTWRHLERLEHDLEHDEVDSSTDQLSHFCTILINIFSIHMFLGGGVTMSFLNICGLYSFHSRLSLSRPLHPSLPHPDPHPLSLPPSLCPYLSAPLLLPSPIHDACVCACVCVRGVGGGLDQGRGIRLSPCAGGSCQIKLTCASQYWYTVTLATPGRAHH